MSGRMCHQWVARIGASGDVAERLAAIVAEFDDFDDAFVAWTGESSLWLYPAAERGRGSTLRDVVHSIAGATVADFRLVTVAETLRLEAAGAIQRREPLSVAS